MATNEEPETILENIYYLLENAPFLENADKGFTLVLEKYEDLAAQIDKIISPANGKLKFDKAHSNFLSEPVIQNFSKYLKKKIK